MPRAIAFPFFVGSFLAFGLRKHTELAPAVLDPDGGYDDVMALIEANRKKNEERRAVQSARNAEIVAGFEARTAAGPESEHQQSAPRLGHALIGNFRGPWAKVQIWGLQKSPNEFDKVWGLEDASGYLPDKLQRIDPNLEVEVTAFAAREYDIWLQQKREFLAGGARRDLSAAETKLLDYGQDPLYSPFVVIDGKYVGGHKELAKAMAENYPDLAGSLLQTGNDDGITEAK